MPHPLSHLELERLFDGLEDRLPSLLAQCREPGERVRVFEHATSGIAQAPIADADATYARRRLHGLLLSAGLAADE